MTRNHHLLLAATLVFPLLGAAAAHAQEPAPEPAQASSGWHRFDERADDSQAPPRPAQPPAQTQAPAPNWRVERVPDQLVVPAGSMLRIRVDQVLSSDHNVAGDGFTATLVDPIVVNGYVVARRGQIINGRVSEADKAGRTKGQSRMALELTEIGLVDGQRLPVRTQLMQYSGGTSKGRDATAVAATTGVGAAIGGAAAGGFGAGIGAAAGAVASTIGVLVTRGRATVIDEEALLTFRTLEPLAVSTTRSAQAFLTVSQQDYEHTALAQRPRTRVVSPTPPLYPPYWYSPWYYGPGFYGPRVSVYYGGHRHGRW